MAVCVIGRETIERADPDDRDSWVPVDRAVRLHEGPCRLARSTTIEPVDPGDPAAPDCEWCIFATVASYLVAGRPACDFHTLPAVLMITTAP